MNKKLCAMILSLTMIFSLSMTTLVSAATSTVPNVDKSQMTASAISAVGQVYINGVALNGSDNMGHFWIDANGRTQAPVRVLVERMGYTISYDKGVVTVPGGPNGDIKITIGKSEISVGGSIVKMDTTAVTISGRTYVPLRYVAEALGAKVEAAGFGSKGGAVIDITTSYKPERTINGVAQKPFNQCEHLQAFLEENADIIDASENDRWVMEYVTADETQLKLVISYGGETGYQIDGLSSGTDAAKQYEFVENLLADVVENPDAVYAKIQEANTILSDGWTSGTGLTAKAIVWRDAHDNTTERIGNVNLSWSDYMYSITLTKAA